MVLLFMGNLISLILHKPCGFAVLTLMGYECGFPDEHSSCTQTSAGALQIQEDEDILWYPPHGEKVPRSGRSTLLNNVHGKYRELMKIIHQLCGFLMDGRYPLHRLIRN